MVRMVYAENIAVLAETALRFLEMVQLDQNAAQSGETDGVQNPAQYQVWRTCELPWKNVCKDHERETKWVVQITVVQVSFNWILLIQCFIVHVWKFVLLNALHQEIHM